MLRGRAEAPGGGAGRDEGGGHGVHRPLPQGPAGCAGRQGLTLVHFSAQLEPYLTHKTTLHTLSTP